MLKFTLSLFHWELYHNNLVHVPHHPHSNIFRKRIIVLNSHICILNLSGLTFLVNLRIHKPNTKTKGFWGLNS